MILQRNSTFLIFLHMQILFEGAAFSVTFSLFSQQDMCDVAENLQRGCSKEVGRVRSRLECTVLCGRDKDCIGASLDAEGMCLHHQLCHKSVPCSGPPDASSTHRYMEPYCLHGTWDSVTKSCACHYGTFGERCNKYYRFCEELSGHPGGQFPIILDPLVDGRHLIKTICNPTSGLVYVFRNSGSPSFNGSWQQYVNGFIIDENNYWLGLEPWHILSKAGVNHMTAAVSIGSFYLHGHYRDFEMSGNESGYAFTGIFDGDAVRASALSGHTMGDCLSDLQGVPFSTWDRDQDGKEGENCASLGGSGWWYNGTCNPSTHMLGWGLDNYNATPPAQRLTILGLDVAFLKQKLVSAYGYLKKP